MKRPAAFERFHAELEAELRKAVGDRRSPLLAMLRYHLEWTDRMGMPEPHGAPDRALGTLCLLCAEAVGGPPSRAMPGAAAMELAQGFAAIHDDIKDGAPERERREAVWWVWGHSQGINAGDGMYALARLALMDIEDRGVPPAVVARAALAFDQACLGLCEGRYSDIQQEAGDGRTPEAHLKTLDATTGALTECAARIGAMAGGATDGAEGAVGAFGRRLGVAAQVRKEVDRIWAPSDGGRSRLIEALDRKRSFPLLYAWSSGPATVRADLEAAARRDSPLADGDLDRIARLLEECGARRFAEDAIERLGREGLEALRQPALPAGAQKTLQEFASYLTQPRAEVPR